MKTKRMTEISLLLAGCVLFSACSGELPLNRRMIVQSAGVDESGGVFTLSVNAFLADRLQMKTQENANGDFFCSSGASVTEAAGRISLTTGREPYFPHNQAVVIGQATAEKGIGAALSFFTEFYECRGTAALYLAQNTAEELLRGAGQNGSIPARELAALSEAGKQAGRAVYTEVFTAARCLTDGERDFCVPILSLEQTGGGEARITLSGTALFSGEKMVETLDERQTQGVLIVSGAAKNMSLKTEVPDEKTGRGAGVQLALENLQTTVRCSTENDSVRIALQVRCDALPAEWNLAAQAVLDETGTAALKTACERELLQRISEALSVCARQHGCDPFGFGRCLARQAPEWWRTHRQDWKKLLPDCDFTVEVCCRIKAGEMQSAGATGKN